MSAPPPAVALREVASGFSAPTAIVNAGDGSGRLFILEQDGLVWILRNGTRLATPFLDVGALTAAEGERGLLGLAFHPDFAANGRFFVYYTRRADGAIRIDAYTVSSANLDVADPASQREVLTIPHPGFSNHNGGATAFGPDGYLYLGVGDGGSGGDPPNNAQNRGVLLGKILRIDVDAPAGYAIPPDNPFVGVQGARAEIWAYGLRNPWRFSFDRATADFFIGDVGQGAVEEIDHVPFGARAGLNFGWRRFEGDACFNPSSNCAFEGHTPPIITYRHDAAGGISVTGGYVYRGWRSAALRGFYIYGDFGSSRIWAATQEGLNWATYELIPRDVLSGISTFGEDEAGEIYVASYFDGRIYAIDGPGPGVNPLERAADHALPRPCRPAAPGANPNARPDDGRCRVGE